MATRMNFFLAGPSGVGIDSSGEVLMHALATAGYWATADREFPSLIKGGQSAFTINCSDQRIRGASKKYQLGVCFGKAGIEYGLEHLDQGSRLIHDFERRAEWDPQLLDKAHDAGISVVYIPTRQIIKDLGVHTIFENAIVIGAVAHALGLDYETILIAMQQRYGKKQALRAMNQTCLQEGYQLIEQPILKMPTPVPSDQTRIIVDGNTALALGAINAGVRTYYAYPMSPSSSILGYFAKTAAQTGIIVKQAEDEITAIQLNIGSMYAGARALTATSGGGFDLMTESISLSGMIEVPCVVVIAQRPGPATGLPTWTAQGDLNLAIHGGHGEFARIVMAVSDQESAFELIQEAFDFAEQFQVPTIVLTEKYIAENRQTIPQLQTKTDPIQRGLIQDPTMLSQIDATERYAITESGVSARWLPGSCATTYFTNGDEHKPDGTLDETPATEAMIEKRIRKLASIEKHLPDPIIYGPANDAEFSFIGWGSTKGVMIDCIQHYAEQGISINYLHFDRLRPLKTDVLSDFLMQNKYICVIENNATGQLHQLIKQQLSIDIPHTLLKWNGRPITIQDITAYIVQ